MSPGNDQLMLKLINGTTDEPDLKNPNNFYKLNFQQSFMYMDLSKKKAEPEKKSKAMTLRELSRKIEEIRSLFIDPAPLLAEYHRRLAWSLSPLLFILSGLSFCRRHPSQGQVRQSFICFIIRRPLLHYFFSLPGVGLSECF